MDSNRVAVVTGAAKGIGKTIALRLADDGFNIAVNDVQSNASALAGVVEEIKSKGRTGSAHVADVSIDDQVRNMVDEVVRLHGRLDAMVANAGVASYDPIVELSTQEWDRVMNINARGTFLCYKYAGLQMIKQGYGGRIVGASSVIGKQGKACLSAYTASKFAIRGLTQAAALEFGPHNGITVNAYAPGAVDTEMTEFPGVPRQEIIERFKKASPLGLVGSSDDIAGLVSFLCSNDSKFITGQTVSINGGTYFD